MSQGWSKLFSRINWLNRPSKATSLGATNLNNGDFALDKIDDRVITLDTIKADKTEVNGMVSDVSLNDATGVLTITYKDGSEKTYNTNLQKIAVNFGYDSETERLILTMPDGTTQYVDLSALITQFEFANSDTIAFSVDASGKVSASIKSGSITEAMLETGYLANIKVEVAKAEAAATQAQSSETSSDYNAKLSRSYAIGGSGIREGEDTDNAMYYYEQAKKTDIGQISSEVAELNSNLDGLEYGEVAGGKNLFNPKCLLNATYDEKTDTITVSNNTKKALDMVFKENTQYTFSAYIKQSNSSTNNRLTVLYTDGTSDTSFLYTQSTSEKYISATSQSGKTISEVKWNHGSTGTATFRNFQIEEGTTSTPYEPYIPSVKMLAEENAQQNTEAMDIKMLGWTVPSECPIQNEVNGNTFIKKVGRVDLGSLDWVYSDSNNKFYTHDTIGIIKGTSTINDVGNAYLDGYRIASVAQLNYDNYDNHIGINITGEAQIKDMTYTDANTLKNAMRGKYMYFELATPITMTIDGNEAVTKLKNDLGGLSFSVSGTTLSITDGTNTWTLEAN